MAYDAVYLIGPKGLVTALYYKCNMLHLYTGRSNKCRLKSEEEENMGHLLKLNSNFKSLILTILG